MPICVAGMHRSGTSLVARILHAAGLYLGPECDLMPAGLGNSDGHWENVRFVEVNEAIFAALGGVWNLLPPIEDGWHLDPKFDPIRDRARALVETFAGRKPWGWKDPRNSITLPFWRQLIPDLKVIVALRNPLDIAHSLKARDGFDLVHSVGLWAQYLVRLQRESPRDRLVTHYESYFLDYAAESQRLLEYCGLTCANAAPAPMVKDALRHNRRPLGEFIDAHFPFELLRLYFEWCAEGGPVFLRTFPIELVKATAPEALVGEVTGDPAAWCLGKMAELVMKDKLMIADLSRQNAALDEAHKNACEQRETLRRENEQMIERLSAKRHLWADRIAGWINTLRGK